MVLDKSIETLEDLVRFLNRKQGFYLKLYDRYLEGDLSDYDHLDDSRKDEVDCNAVCDDIVECIKAISEEAQVRGLAKKAKVLCTLDGQDEERCILDEWLLKVVRLLDDDANWNRMLAPIEGEDMNNVFYAILFRLTYVVNFLNELSTKTEQEYYGGRRTDVMPYYIGESKLKEAQSISLGSALSIFEDPEPEEVEDRYVLIEVDGGDEYFIENIEPVRRLEPGEEILFTGPTVKYIKYRLARMNRWDILDVVKIIMRPMSESKERRKPLKELTQDEFNRLARERDEFRAQTAISPVEKNNLYADIKDFEEEFRDLQATAERLPDSYIDRVCGTASYPFEDVIDEVQNVEDWCSEAEEFLKDDINNWGTMREANIAGMLARRGSRMGGTKPVKVECCLCGKKDLDENMHFINKRYYCDECFMSESDKTYKAKAGKKWLKGDKLVKSKASADSFESKTEPTQRLNQMKKDGKLDKDAKIDVVEESIFDFEAQNQPMYRFAKQKHDATGAIRKHSGDPYWVHPEGVAKIAAAYGGTDVEIQAAMAHDTLEDTNCSYEELEEMFGDEVASIVREITNDTEEVDRLGKEQYINLELISLSHPALFVKLCDMYYNQMDFPAEAQKQRMIKNINYLLANREDDLNENEIALIEGILQTLLN